MAYDLRPDDPEVVAWLDGIGHALHYAITGIQALVDDPNGDIGEARGRVHRLSDELFKGFHLQHKNWMGEPKGFRKTSSARTPRDEPTLDSLA